MPYIDEGVIQYAIYENESEFPGVAEVPCPPFRRSPSRYPVLVSPGT